VDILVATSFWDTNLAGALVGGVIGLLAALVASVIPIIWTFYHDRYKRNLEERDRYLHLSSALVNEISHVRNCVDDALKVVTEFAQMSVLPTERLNTQFLQAAQIQLATMSSSADIFPGVSRALQEVEHCNRMLNRYENEGRKVFEIPNFGLQQFLKTGVPEQTEKLLKSTMDLLLGVGSDVEKSRQGVSASKPRLFP
jgi:hypothetical protein